jgi:hypothetical protein
MPMLSRIFSARGRRHGDERLLDQAIAAWREDPGEAEKLSEHARTFVIDAALNPAHDPAAPASLFLPARRLALAGVLPAVLGAALLLLLGHAGISPRRPGSVVVEKKGDVVVFNVKNGGRQHTICKSSNPNRFDCDGALRVEGGRFVEPVSDSSSIVFYRID